jgi:hypothetical protein
MTKPDERKSEVLQAALQRLRGPEAKAVVEGHEVFILFPGDDKVTRYELSHASWEVLDAAVERRVPVPQGAVLDLLAPRQEDEDDAA